MRDRATQTLEELARRAGMGDPDAFDRLVRRIHPRLVRWARVMTGGPDEVVQQTLIRMHTGLTGFRSDSRLSTWAYRIARNVWLDLERARRTRGRVEEPLCEATEGAHAVEATDPAPDETLARREEGELLLACFDGLPARQREVLELVDLQGYAPVEASEIMGVTASTARVHLHRARRAVRQVVLARHPDIAEEYGT